MILEIASKLVAESLLSLYPTFVKNKCFIYEVVVRTV